MARSLDLKRKTTKLVIDHHTVHHASAVASIHYLEKDENDQTIGGGDIDGVTAEELSIAGELTEELSADRLSNFVHSLADGTPVEMDTKPAAATSGE